MNTYPLAPCFKSHFPNLHVVLNISKPCNTFHYLPGRIQLNITAVTFGFLTGLGNCSNAEHHIIYMQLFLDLNSQLTYKSKSVLQIVVDVRTSTVLETRFNRPQ